MRRRSLLTGGAALALLPSFREQAEAATAFTAFAFTASGEPTARTMPDRLAEIKNVLDFGADPTGVSDSQSAIQAAVNWTSGANRGTIYFPQGTYLLNSSVTYNYNGNLSIRFYGEPGTVIVGNFSGFLFDRLNTNSGSPNNTIGGRVFQNLNMQNSNNTGGCVRIGSTIGAAFRDCTFEGNTGVTTEDSAGVSSQSILFDNCHFTANGANVTTNAIIMGGGGVLLGCDFADNDTAVRAYGLGFHISGCRCEHANTGIMLGVDSSGTAQTTSGFYIGGCSFEGNGTSIDFVGACSGFVIGPIGPLQGHPSSNSGYPTNINNSQYGVRVRAGNAQGGMFYGIGPGSVFDVAGISIGNASSRANNIISNCNSAQTGGLGVAWVLPTNAYTAFFEGCNTDPIWTFSQLPTGGNVFEGDEFNISDSTTATWGATVSGTGSNHCLVRYNGTNWTVVGV